MNEPKNIPIGYLSEIGTLGGQTTTEAKKIAARVNGLAGGRPRKIYIYGILNLNNGRVEYVGQTSDIKMRMRAHATGKAGIRLQKPCPFEMGIVILAATDERHANEVERLFWEHYKSFGECTMGGTKYVPYSLREPKWLALQRKNILKTQAESV